MSWKLGRNATFSCILYTTDQYYIWSSLLHKDLNKRQQHVEKIIQKHVNRKSYVKLNLIFFLCTVFLTRSVVKPKKSYCVSFPLNLTFMNLIISYIRLRRRCTTWNILNFFAEFSAHIHHFKMYHVRVITVFITASILIGFLLLIQMNVKLDVQFGWVTLLVFYFPVLRTYTPFHFLATSKRRQHRE